MPSVPVPADPGWDDDLARLDRDPMTAEEREASLDRLCELDEPDPEDEEEYWDHDDLTAEELADIREAAADEVLAVAAASTGRRGPGHPGSARVFPGGSASAAAGFGTGMPLDVPSSSQGGRSSSSPTARSGGRPRPGGATTPSRRGIPSDRVLSR